MKPSIDGNLAALAQYEREQDAAQRRDEWMESIMEEQGCSEEQAREVIRKAEEAGPDAPL